MITLADHTRACDYPGHLDQVAVEAALRDYVDALGIKRNIVRLERGWSARDPHVDRLVTEFMREFAARLALSARSAQAALSALSARDAQDARSARSARDARDARSARSARSARDAQDALSALSARDAQDALSAQDARSARSAQDALSARLARDAQDALSARDARSAQDAQAALSALSARDAQDARSARSARSARDALSALSAQDARSARSAQDALSARLARDALARWVISIDGWYYSWDLSWIAVTAFGARQTNAVAVQKWSEPLLSAFVAGAWRLIWTETDLIWVAKPAIKTDESRRLHCETGPALVADDCDAYFWRGTLVPDEWIAEKSLDAKTALTWGNIEQRRAACEIVGWNRILSELSAKTIDRHDNPQVGELVEVELPDIGRERFLRVMCGTSREFALPVPPTVRTAIEAQAWTCSMSPNEFVIPEVRT